MNIRMVLTAILIIGSSLQPAMADSFSGSIPEGALDCQNQPFSSSWIRNFPQSDGYSCAYVTKSFKPLSNGTLTVSMTLTDGSWGQEGFPQGIPGTFAILGPYPSPSQWGSSGNVFFTNNVTRSIPVQANQTYYLHVGYGGWNPPFTSAASSFTASYTLPAPPLPPAKLVPLPLWSNFMFAAGVIGVLYYRVRRLNSRTVTTKTGS